MISEFGLICFSTEKLNLSLDLRIQFWIFLKKCTHSLNLQSTRKTISVRVKCLDGHLRDKSDSWAYKRPHQLKQDSLCKVPGTLE